MRLHVHRSGPAFLEALGSATACHYAIFDRGDASPAVLQEAEALARERGHRDLTAAPALRVPAERLLREYFDAAARADPEARYAYSARVLLAIPDYPDVALLFMLRALEAAEPHSTLHALIADPWKAELAKFEAGGEDPPVFHAGSLRGFARASRSLARGVLASPQASACDVVIVTLGHAVANGAADAYFGELAASLAQKCRVLTVYAAPGRRLKLDATPAIAPLEAFLRPFDALGAWAHARAAPETLTPGGSPDAPLTAYLKAREQDAGEVAMLHVMTRAFERMLARLKPHTVVYPFENRSWEKNLLRAARASGARSIGYQHSSLTPRHLAFSSAAGLAGMADLPDEIITCGEVTAGLIASGIPQARSLVTAGAALRARRLAVPPPTTWGVLAAVSSSRSEAWEILRVVFEASAESATPIIVRTHPTIPIDDLYAQFQWPAHVMLSRGRTLAADFADTAIVAYSSSTVALEGMLYGRLPVYLDIGDVPSGDPLHGDHAFVSRVSTGRELAGAVERMRASTASELASLRESARAYAERYLVEPTAANVERMAARIAAC